jgi:hypothetical protein
MLGHEEKNWDMVLEVHWAVKRRVKVNPQWAFKVRFLSPY